MKRWAICYVSNRREELDQNAIQKIFNRTEESNNQKNISGILLHSNGNFFQVIEGEANTIKDLFEKIEDDHRHHHLIKIFDREIENERYHSYDCQFHSKSTSIQASEIYYLGFMNNLDRSSQIAVQNILKAFVE